MAVERGRSSGGSARTGRARAAPRGPAGPRSCGLGVGAPEAVFRSLEDVTASLALRLDGVRAAGEALGAGTLAAELRGRAVRAELAFPSVG